MATDSDEIPRKAATFTQQPQPGAPTEELIGPLTAREWAEFRLREDDTDTDFLYCCADTSELRTAIFQMLRMGGGREYHAGLHSVWAAVDRHPGLGDHPLVRKLYDYYIDGQEPGPTDADMAEMMSTDPGTVELFLRVAPSTWNLDDPDEVLTALGRLVGRSYASGTPADRRGYINKIAALVDRPAEQILLVVNAFRGSVNLPADPPLTTDLEQPATEPQA